MILAEGVEAVWARHEVLGERTRRGVEALGLELFANPAFRSNTVTAIALPDGVSAKDVTGRLLRDFDVIVGAGQGYLSDAMIRIGHMGWCSEEEIDHCLAALGEAIG